MTTTKAPFHSYLEKQSNFRQKWKDYLKLNSRFDLTDRLDELTPFHGTTEYKKLSNEKKNNLFLNHIRLMAEALIVLEQILLFGYYTNRHRPNYATQTFSKPFTQFTVEELYHSMAFKHFLYSHSIFHQFPNPLITNCHWMKNAFAFIVRHFPGALYICSPRLEALSLAYYTEIKQAYPNGAENNWLKLHQLHYEDEIYHIPLNYHFHDTFVKDHGFIKTFFGAILFFMMMQIMLLKVAYEAMSQTFPEKGKISRAVWTFKYILWSIFVAKASKGSRPIMKKNFQKMKPKYGFAFYFLSK